jgi:hypothetical protein
MTSFQFRDSAAGLALQPATPSSGTAPEERGGHDFTDV